MLPYRYIQQAILIEENLTAHYPNISIAKYYMGLRATEATFYTKVIEECFKLKYYDLSESEGQHFGMNPNVTLYLKQWCQMASNIWFVDIYWYLWRQSKEKYIMTQLLDPVIMPVISFINFFLLLFSLPVFVHLDRGQNKALWCFLHWYTVFRVLRFLVEVLPDMVCSLFFNCERSIKSYSGLCRVLTFSCHVMHYTADWINITLLLDHIITLKARRRQEGFGRGNQRYQTNGRGLSRFGSKLVIVFVVIGLVVVNAHTLWLYSSKKNKDCELDPEGQPFIFITGYPYLLQIVHRFIPNLLGIFGVMGLYLSACKNRSCAVDTRIAIYFGLLYILFSLPSTIQYIYFHYLRYSDIASTFPFFKLNYIMNNLVKLWSELRDIFSISLLFCASCEFRQAFCDSYRWFFTVIWDSVHVWRSFYSEGHHCECHCLRLRCVKANSADIYPDEIEETTASNRRDSAFNDSIPPFWTVCACWRTEAWVDDRPPRSVTNAVTTTTTSSSQRHHYRAIVPIEFQCYWLEEAKRVGKERSNQEQVVRPARNIEEIEEQFENIECSVRSVTERSALTVHKEITV